MFCPLLPWEMSGLECAAPFAAAEDLSALSGVEGDGVDGSEDDG